MVERCLSRPQIMDQAKQELDQARGSFNRTVEQLNATDSKFNSLPFPLRAPLRKLTEEGREQTVSRLQEQVKLNEHRIFLGEEKLKLLEEAKDLNLETFKTYTYGYTYGGRDESDESYTIFVIKGRLEGRHIRVNSLRTKRGNNQEEDKYVGFRFEKERQMSQKEAERIFDRYHSLLVSRNQQEGIRRSLLHGEHPLIYWRKITQPQPRPTNKRKATKFHF